MTFNISHNDDGKGKWQSHSIEFYMDSPCTYIDDICFTSYGSTKKEAYEIMLENLDDLHTKITKARHKLCNSDIADIFKEFCIDDE